MSLEAWVAPLSVGVGGLAGWLATHQTSGQRGEPGVKKARRQGNGVVLLKRTEDSHVCDPPDRPFPDTMRISTLTDPPWSYGDTWLCDCGFAWCVGSCYGSKEWQRSPKDDLQ